MDWTQIITTLITILVPTGGFLGVFTIREKKTALMLENASKLNDGWTALANERQETIKDKEKKIEEKDAKIDELYRISSSLRHMLDDANTARAVAEVLLCDKTSCVDRNPPFGRHFHLSCKDCDRSGSCTEEEERIDESIRG